MATYKRRIVYLSDEEWDAAKRLAERNSVTASELIRDCLRRGHLRDECLMPATKDQTEIAGVAMTQTERDAILRKINKG
jgi:hypothetical protein